MDPLDQVYSYRAGGKKVVLRPDKNLIGVDLTKCRHAVAPSAIRKVSDTVGVVSRSLIGVQALRDLTERNAVFPVFSQGGTHLVALPEVRVEPPFGVPAAEGLEQLNQWLKEHSDQVQVKAERSDRIVLEPRSGYGPDAVVLADNIAEHFKPLTASPRFLRIAPHPR